MIPLNIQIKNFLSYGALQKIDFEPYNLICLSGKNGHGKSALLDAITWAVWGQARKVSNTSKADEGLLRLGQSQMFVALDFKVNSQKYRIKREFTLLNQKATTNLDFAVWEKNTQQYKSLTDKTIRATQLKIEQIIGLTFDSFVNSAFLKQGQSNEFSKKSPKERKEILANILGLTKYESMRKIALEKYKDSLNSKQNIINLQQHLNIEINNKSKIQENLEDIENSLKNYILAESEIKKKFIIILEDKKNLEAEKDKIKLLKFKLDNINNIINQDKINLNNSFILWRNNNKKIRNSNFENINIKIKELATQEIDLKNSATNKIKLQEELFLQKNLSQYIFQKQTKLQEKAEQDKKLKELKTDLIDLNKLEVFLETEEKQFERRKNFYQTYVVTGNKLNLEFKNCDQKINLIQNSLKPCCPLCKQEISVDQKTDLNKQFSKEKSIYNHQVTRIGKLLKSLKEIIVEQHKNIEIIKKNIETIKTKKTIFEQLEIVNSKLNLELEDIQKNINKTLKDIKLFNNNLINNNINNTENLEYKTVSENLVNLENKIKIEEEKIANHQKIVEKLEQLRSFSIDNSSLEQDKLLQNNKKTEIKELILKLKNLKQEKKTLETELVQEEKIKNTEQEIINQENILNQEQNNIYKNKEIILQQKGALEQQQKNILKLESEYLINEQKLKEINLNTEQFQALSVALSKDGIQALLIEDAIPEIEQEANYLLSKLTDNQAQLFIESLRDLKSGGTKETLDIKISDPSGIRPYELFSGGEAFRIDFALRIAISKLLARRAGTALETLIIDEGFGSQDEEGLSNIMDTIHKIQEDFAKVIIVSHLPSMKDQFPVHFIIQKGPDGSGVKIVENG